MAEYSNSFLLINIKVMIEAKTYLMSSGWDQDVQFSPTMKNFTSIENEAICSDILSELSDLDNLMGAIVIKNDNEEFIGVKYWNYVANLWANILYGIEDYLNKGEASVLFPNNPFAFEFAKTQEKFQFRFINRKDNSVVKSWDCSEKELLSKLLNEGLNFFSKARKYNQHDTAYHEVYNYFDKQSELLRKKLM